MTLVIQPIVIDLYHGDAVESFAAVRQSGIRGIIHKATEGGDVVDSTYAARRHDATAQGLLWGAYHFMRPGDPKAHAAHFLSTAAPDAGTLLALDHEDKDVPLADAIAFMEAVEAEAERSIVLYSGSLLKEQIGDATAADVAFLKDRRLWLAQYANNPTWPAAWAAPWLWQFTGDGQGPTPHTIPGIRGEIDIDSYAGLADQLAAEWAGSPPATS